MDPEDEELSEDEHLEDELSDDELSEDEEPSDDEEISEDLYRRAQSAMAKRLFAEAERRLCGPRRRLAAYPATPAINLIKRYLHKSQLTQVSIYLIGNHVPGKIKVRQTIIV